MPDGGIVLGIEKIDTHLAFRKHLKGHGAHEVGGAVGHDDPNPGSQLHQPPEEIYTFIGGYSAAYPQNDMFCLQNVFFHVTLMTYLEHGIVEGAEVHCA
jgi:hypothetical protein